ncbi:MAG: porin, partial [Gammaproteobacteria bacterium]
MNRIAKIKAGFAVSALALAVSPAMATDIRFDGFASFVAGQVLDKDELVGDSFRGYDERIDFQQNSLFALQARADLQEKLSATAQIIAKGSEGYDAKFNWAYLTYELTDEVSLKAGRFRSPLFMYSDFLDVGYAYHWISPPDSVYDLSGFDSSDGVMAEYQTDIGPITSLATFGVYRTRTDLELGTLESENSWTATWSLNFDWLTFRLVHSEGETSIRADAFDSLEEGLLAFNVSQSAIDDMLLESDLGTFNGVGISIDTGAYFAVAEYTEVAAGEAFSGDPSTSWYISGGARFGKWTVYATAETTEAGLKEDALNAVLTDFDQDVASKTTQQAQLGGAIAGLLAGAPVPGLTIADVPELQANYNLLGLALRSAPDLRNGVLAIFSQTRTDQDIYSVGFRYNFHPSAAFKMEYMEMDDKV